MKNTLPAPGPLASVRAVVENYLVRRYGIVSAPMPDDEVQAIVDAALGSTLKRPLIECPVCAGLNNAHDETCAIKDRP